MPREESLSQRFAVDQHPREHQQEFERARQDYERARQIWSETLAPEHPNVGVALEYLGIVLRKLGRYDEAEAVLAESIANRITAFGPRHPEVAAPLNALAVAQFERGDEVAAQGTFDRVIAHYRATGLEPRRLAVSLSNRGELARRAGERFVAEVAFREALVLLDGTATATHPDRGFPLLGLVTLAIDAGDVTEAARRVAELDALRDAGRGCLWPTNLARSRSAQARGNRRVEGGRRAIGHSPGPQYSPTTRARHPRSGPRRTPDRGLRCLPGPRRSTSCQRR